MIITNGAGLLKYTNGQLDKKTLSAASETVAAGIYDATTLSTVDADLATTNIKSGATIFGKAGISTVVNIEDTTAVAADVGVTKYFYTSAGVRTVGTHE
jgi:hypothetical protein